MAITIDGTTGITTPGLVNAGTESVVGLTTTGNTILGDSSTDTLNVGNGGLVKDASGNVGIGVTPSAASLATIQSGYGILTGNNQINISANAYYNAGWKYVGTGVATLYTQNTANSPGGHDWRVAPSGTAGNAIAFTQAMTLDSSGNLLVGTTSQFGSGKVCVSYDGTVYNGVALRTTNAALNSNFVTFYNSATTNCGGISQNGTTTVNYITSSDYRLKENIAPMIGALDKVVNLNPVTYIWKDTDNEAGEGFIAHELQAICPLAVSGEKDAVNEDGSIKAQGIDPSKLVALLTAAIQELKAIIDTQNDTINNLTTRLETLEGAV